MERPEETGEREPEPGGGAEERAALSATSPRGGRAPPPVSALSAFSHVPPRRLDPPEHRYFCRPGWTGVISLYDCVFKRDLGYNQKLHRDDRAHAKSLYLHVNEEEWERPVGVLTSSVYGRRWHLPLEPLNHDNRRANYLMADFYRKNGLASMKESGFGYISPA